MVGYLSTYFIIFFLAFEKNSLVLYLLKKKLSLFHLFHNVKEHILKAFSKPT